MCNAAELGFSRVEGRAAAGGEGEGDLVASSFCSTLTKL